MTGSTLPSSPTAFAKATWNDIAPYYAELAERPLDGDGLEVWLPLALLKHTSRAVAVLDVKRGGHRHRERGQRSRSPPVLH